MTDAPARRQAAGTERPVGDVGVLQTVQGWLASGADEYRAQLIARYGQDRGSKVKYVEAFQLNQYGRQVKADALNEMFPQ